MQFDKNKSCSNILKKKKDLFSNQQRENSHTNRGTRTHTLREQKTNHWTIVGIGER